MLNETLLSDCWWARVKQLAGSELMTYGWLGCLIIILKKVPVLLWQSGWLGKWKTDRLGLNTIGLEKPTVLFRQAGYVRAGQGGNMERWILQEEDECFSDSLLGLWDKLEDIKWGQEADRKYIQSSSFLGFWISRIWISISLILWDASKKITSSQLNERGNLWV